MNTVLRYGLIAVIGVVTVALYAVAWPTLHVTHVVSAGVAPVVAGFSAFPLLLARTNPVSGWAISVLSALVISVALPHQPHSALPWQVTQIVCLFFLVFAVALQADWTIVGLVWAATSLLFAARMPGAGAVVGWPLGFAGLVLFALILRWLMASRRALAAQQEATDLERARRAILEEKARIARDLHDVVAHHMSMVVVQAQTAPYRLTGVSEPIRAEFNSIGATARTALDEVRALLGVLRSDAEAAARAPQPTAAQLHDLVTAAERAGMTVTWELVGELDPLADLVAVTLYRILQESLANAARHAPDAAVTVRIDGAADHVVLTVRNGPGGAPSGVSSGGLGIAGMGERARAVGGSVDTAASPDGGFLVIARLPREVGPSV